MSWLHRKVTEPRRICVISAQQKAIKVVFKYSQYDWSEENEDIVHRYYMQHISENLYKVCPNHDIKDLFK
jgi:hypothetical protein